MNRPRPREIRSALARFAGLACRNLREDVQGEHIFHCTAVDPKNTLRRMALSGLTRWVVVTSATDPNRTLTYGARC
jgi:hypothetical protein